MRPPHPKGATACPQLHRHRWPAAKRDHLGHISTGPVTRRLPIHAPSDIGLRPMVAILRQAQDKLLGRPLRRGPGRSDQPTHRGASEVMHDCTSFPNPNTGIDARSAVSNGKHREERGRVPRASDTGCDLHLAHAPGWVYCIVYVHLHTSGTAWMPGENANTKETSSARPAFTWVTRLQRQWECTASIGVIRANGSTQNR